MNPSDIEPADDGDATVNQRPDASVAEDEAFALTEFGREVIALLAGPPTEQV